MNNQRRFPKDLIRITAICSVLTEIHDNEKNNGKFLTGHFENINQETFSYCLKYINALSNSLISLHQERIKEQNERELETQKAFFLQVRKPFIEETLREIKKSFKTYAQKEKD